MKKEEQNKIKEPFIIINATFETMSQYFLDREEQEEQK